TYERDLSDVMRVQDEVAQAIARQIRAQLTPDEQKRLVGRRLVSPEAHDEYLKGRYHLEKATEEEIGKSIEHFQRAVEKDPAYAAAYAGLAESYVAYTDFYLAPSETMIKARRAAARALELDETLAESHTSQGVVRFLFDWDWTGAEKEFKRAIELNSNSTDAHVWYANFLAQMARPQEAAAEIARA